MTKLKACQLHYDHMLPPEEEPHKECVKWETKKWAFRWFLINDKPGARVLLFQKCCDCDNTREIYEDEL